MRRSTVLVTAPHWVTPAQELLRAAGADLAFMDGPVNEETLLARLTTAPIDAIVLRGSCPIGARVFDAAPRLKIIAKNGAGVDSVDVLAAAERGVQVAVAAGANAEAVAEHALSMMLALVRGLHTLDRKVRRGGWEGASYQGRDFRGSTVGIVGFGAIGQATARLATALGARVLVATRTGGPGETFERVADLDALLRRVEVLSLHCALTPATRGLIGARELALLSPGAVVVNTARGAVIDTAALVDALRSGHLGGAGLDTFDPEPVEAGHPLLGLDNVILTPHVAGVTRQSALQVALTTARNVVDVLQGRPLPPGHLAGPPIR